MMRFQGALGRMHDGWIFGGYFLYLFAFTLFLPTPWMPDAIGFSLGTALAYGALPILVGLVRNSPPAITAGFILASMGPYNQVTVILGFFLGVYLGCATLYRFRRNFHTRIHEAFVKRGFYWLAGLTLYIAAVWVVRMNETTDGWSFLALASSLLTVPFAVYSLSYLRWDDETLSRAGRYLFYIGVALALSALVYPLMTGRWEQYTQAFFVFFKTLRTVVDLPIEMDWIDPDFNRVGFSSSHYFAAWMLIFGAGAFAAIWLKRRRLVFAIATIGAVYCFALGENAHVIPGAVAGTVAALSMTAAGGKYFLKPRTVAAGVVVLMVAATAVFISVLYFNGGRYALSRKASLYESAVERLRANPGTMLFGDGPASYASRAANKRLDEGNIEIEYSFPFAISDFTQPAFKEAITEALKFEGGSTMKRLLSGAAGMVMEWGIVGTLFVLFLLYRLIRLTVRTWKNKTDPNIRAVAIAAVFGIVLLTVSLAVRTYFEYTELTAFTGVLLMLASVASAGPIHEQRKHELSKATTVHTP